MNTIDTDKFKMRLNPDNGVYTIIDIETGRELDLDNKYHVQQLLKTLNQWNLIIKDKWGLE